jgi:Glycosyltransferase like family
VKLALCVSTIMPGQLAKCLDQCMPLASSALDLRVALNGPSAEDAWKMCGTRVVLPQLTGYPQAMDKLWRTSDADVFLFMHDDVLIYEPNWDEKLLGLFVNPKVTMAGFYGAKWLGSTNMYSTGGFEVHKLSRAHTYSSLRNRKEHGAAEVKGPVQVGMLDGFSMCLRREFLETIDGWSWWPYPHHSYDLAMSCMVVRHGGTTWVYPVECEHPGGQTTTMGPYQSWVTQAWPGGDMGVYLQGHEKIFNEFRDVLPIRVP